MHCLNYRIGILFRENQHKKSYEMRYFFIDDQANLFYVSSLPRLQKVIRLSSDFKQIKSKLIQMGQKSFTLNKYIPSAPRNYQSQAILPFSNRTCIDIKERQTKDERGYQLFGLIDEDTPLLYDEILRLTGKKKIQVPRRKSVIEEQKNNQQIRTLDFLKRFLQNENRFRMDLVGQNNQEVQFQGEGSAKEANGKGVQTLIKQGITYAGYFKDGKKHGEGLLVSQTLDSLKCEFIQDQLVGI